MSLAGTQLLFSDRNLPIPPSTESTSPPPRVQNTIDRICWFPVYERGGGGTGAGGLRGERKTGLILET